MKKLFPVLALVAGIAIATPSYGASTPPLVGHAAKAGGTVLNVPIPTEILSIPLTDSSGKNFTLASLKGKTVVLTDFLTL